MEDKESSVLDSRMEWAEEEKPQLPLNTHPGRKGGPMVTTDEGCRAALQ